MAPVGAALSEAYLGEAYSSTGLVVTRPLLTVLAGAALGGGIAVGLTVVVVVAVVALAALAAANGARCLGELFCVLRD